MDDVVAFAEVRSTYTALLFTPSPGTKQSVAVASLIASPAYTVWSLANAPLYSSPSCIAAKVSLPSMK